MFGEGRHPNIKAIYESKLAPFLTQASSNFWDSRLWYFNKGLYYQGGQVCWFRLFCFTRKQCTASISSVSVGWSSLKCIHLSFQVSWFNGITPEGGFPAFRRCGATRTSSTSLLTVDFSTGRGCLLHTMDFEVARPNRHCAASGNRWNIAG